MENDFISREAAIKTTIDFIITEEVGDIACEINQRLRKVTAADVHPVRKAKWEYSEQQGLWFSRCSGDDGCGGYVPGCTSYRFCPNCGADMRGTK